MGQFLIVHGPDNANVRELTRRGTDCFYRLTGLQPHDQAGTDFTIISKFPRTVRGSTGVFQSSCGSWACAAGTWFLDDVPQDALLTETQRRAGDVVDSLAPALDGAFVVATGNSGGDVHIITDRLGTLHAYLTRIGACVVLSTSSLVLAALTRPQWNVTSCIEFLATGTVFADRTLFEGIHKLLPASVYFLESSGRIKRHAYWSVGAASETDVSGDDSVTDLASALRSAMTRVSRGFPRAIMDLTGGLDSRALLGAILANELPFETVVNGPSSHPDVLTANRLAREFGLKHRHQQLPTDWPRRLWGRAREAFALCDAEYDVLEYGRILENQARLAREFDATVNGSGGEFAKGYWWELLMPLVGRRGYFPARRLAAGRFATDRGWEGVCQKRLPGGLTEHFTTLIQAADVGLETRRNTTRMDNIYATLRMQRWQGRIASATNRIWPCISPFTLRRPLEIALSAPPRVRIRNRLSRRLIERFDRQLAAEPLAQGYPALPLRIDTAHHFLPMAAEFGHKVWSRVAGPPRESPTAPPDSGLRALGDEPEVRELVNTPTMATAGLYDLSALETLVSDALSDGIGPAYRVGRVLTLELAARSLQLPYSSQ